MQTFTGKEYLKIDIASNFGLDKKDWSERIAWFDQNEEHLEKRLPQAENQPLYYAGVQAWRDTQKGLPTGYTTSLDAAASGIQILSVLSRCETSARICGVLSTGHREDAYTNFYKIMKEMAGDSLGQISRQSMKEAAMPAFYDSKRRPKEVFGEGELLDMFWLTLEKGAPGAWALNKGLKTLWRPYAESHDWLLPDNFHVHVPVEGTMDHLIKVGDSEEVVSVTVLAGQKSGQAMAANIVHSVDGMVVREMHRRCSYDPEIMAGLIELLVSGKWNQQPTTDREKDRLVKTLWNHAQTSGFLSARILELLDERNMCLVNPSIIQHMISTLPEQPFDLISIHDCFRANPNHGNMVRKTYNTILAQICGSNLMSWIASTILGKPVRMPLGNLKPSQVLQADYALC